MPSPKEKATSTAGITVNADGESYIPSSQRADGSTRKEIRVRPGYRPPEDIATYKNRSAEAWKNRESGGVPGADEPHDTAKAELKNKNAKRREAARKKTREEEDDERQQLLKALQAQNLPQKKTQANSAAVILQDEDVENQKRIRNQLKKLRAIRDLKQKKADGEKLSPDQLLKIGKETEVIRDLKKLNYDGPELDPA